MQLLLLAAAMTGDLSWKVAWSALPDVLTTQSGHALIMSLLFVPFLLAFSLFPAGLKSSTGVCIGIALVLGLTVYRSAFGHAASDGTFTLREFIQFLHLCSIVTWGGGVLIAGLVVVPDLILVSKPEELLQFGKRLSGTVTIALLVVIVSGVYNAWRGLGGSVSPLPHTPWGRMLIAKLCLVLMVFFHGGRVRLLLNEDKNRRSNRIALITRWLGVEALLMIVVLIVSAWLANLAPADM